ncbi:uncharacterized protein LOC143260974 [Megalopta genalis]|uniref:uncharacterized protein LOC143260974 n=1 Tax=Megalopta genalis TaxID=115081 RepID=UPI003FD2B774
MVERFHRQFKAAIRCQQNVRWTEVLPTILLGIRAAWREDLQSTAAELVYGETLRLPGEFLVPQRAESLPLPGDFVAGLREHFATLAPTPGSNHSTKRVFVFKDLATAEHVFVRNDAVRGILQPPYDGPYRVLDRGDRTYSLSIRDKTVTVTKDRLKPAYLLATDPAPLTIPGATQPALPGQSEGPPPPPPPTPSEFTGQPTRPSPPSRGLAVPPPILVPPGAGLRTTRSGRRATKNGSLERSHIVLTEYLKHYIESYEEWDLYLPFAMISYNTSVHEATNFTPHELIFGKTAR